MRVANALVLRLEIERLAGFRRHSHRAGCGEPDLELLSPGTEKRARGQRHVAFDCEFVAFRRTFHGFNLWHPEAIAYQVSTFPTVSAAARAAASDNGTQCQFQVADVSTIPAELGQFERPP